MHRRGAQHDTSLQQQETSNTKQHEIVANLRDYLFRDKNFANVDMDYKELAASLATNRTSLFVAVKTVTGNSLQEFINFLRLEQAKKMLDSHSKDKLESIAFECGFNQYQTFRRLFKKKYQLTPAEYNRLGKKE